MIPQNVNQAMSMMAAFSSYQILLTAVSLNIFVLLKDPLTSERLAVMQGWDKKATGRFLDAVTALGFLIKKNRKYKSTEKALQGLTYENNANVVSILLRWADLGRNYDNLMGIIKGTAAPTDLWVNQRNPIEREAILAHLFFTGSRVAEEVESLINFSGVKKFMDLGCARGAYARVFLQKNPALKAILVDMPKVIPTTARQMKKDKLVKRCEFVKANAMVEVPSGADLIFISCFIHAYSVEDGAKVLSNVYDALPRHGRLIIHDYCMTEDTIGVSREAAVFDINMMVSNSVTRALTYNEIRDMAMGAGFSKLKILGKDQFNMHVIEVIK